MNLVPNKAINQLFLLRKKPSEYYYKFVSFARKMVPRPVKERMKSGFLKSYYERIRRLLIKSKKSPRVFVKKGLSREGFFNVLNNRKINYVLLRWWEDFPQMPEGEDMDILIKDEQRDLINDLLVHYDNGTGLKCDIYTVRGSKYGSHRGLPYFQYNLAEKLLSTRTYYNGIYVPSSHLYFASLSYHAIFHKGNKSGLPGFGEILKKIEHDYKEILTNQSKNLKLNVEVNIQALYDWLRKEEFLPAEDTLSKLVEINSELAIFQTSLHSDIRGGELLVYIIRERIIKDNLLHDFTSFLEKEYNFDIIETKELNSIEQGKCSIQIRGGKWDKGPYEYSGGLPKAFVVAFDYHPEPLNLKELKIQPRMTNRNSLIAKYNYREKVNNSSLKRSNYNGLHSADNEQDAWHYISILGKNFEEKIFREIELRRNRYAKTWGVIKILSKGPNFKLELIKYKQGVAVKKTFRPGNENLLKTEVWAAKELSNEIPNIIPILEEGEGYIIFPFNENEILKFQIEENHT